MKRRLLYATLGLALTLATRADAGLVGQYTTYTNPPKQVNYDPAAPDSNFDNPGTTNQTVAYNVYISSDSQYVYGAVEANPDAGGTDPVAAGVDFANIYFSTNPQEGANVGFEITNRRSFGLETFPPDYNDVAPPTLDFVKYTSSLGRVIEFKIAFSYFTDDPDNIGFTKLTPNSPFQIRLSQSFGYSVAGGPAYGADRLGQVIFQPGLAAVPEPTTLGGALVGVAFGLFQLRRRSRRDQVVQAS